jgi:hypothetical protein
MTPNEFSIQKNMKKSILLILILSCTLSCTLELDGNCNRTKHKTRNRAISDSSKIKIDSSKIEYWKEIDETQSK